MMSIPTIISYDFHGFSCSRTVEGAVVDHVRLLQGSYRGPQEARAVREEEAVRLICLEEDRLLSS